MAHVMLCVDVPEDGFDDFEFAKYLEDCGQLKRSRTMPASNRISILMGKVLSACSSDRSTTSPSQEDTDDTCVVDYTETAYSLLYQVHSASDEIRHVVTGDECDEIRNTQSCGNSSEIQNILTGGEADGWYPLCSPTPSPVPSATPCLRTVRVSPKSHPLNNAVPSILRTASVLQASMLSSDYTSPISQVSSSAEAAKQVEAFEAGDRPIAPALKRTPLRSSAAPFEPPERESREEMSSEATPREDTSSEATPRTTLMLCNIPNRYSRCSLMDVLRSEGFGDHVTLIYMPMNLRSQTNFGYAFVDFDSVRVANECKEHLEGFTRWNEPSEKVMSVGWSDTQGLDAHIQRYRNSPLMHESVDDEVKPALFENGARVPFPEPTKPIRAPRLRRSGSQISQTREERSMTV